MSSRTAQTRKRKATAQGETAIFDIDYEMTVAVAVERGEWVADEEVSIDRDRLLLAVRECLLLPASLSENAFILMVPDQAESTGAAVQTSRGNPLAAGTIEVRIRVAEAIIPTQVLQDIISSAVSVDAVDSQTNFTN